MDGRLTIANMAIEAGAKNGIFPVDDVCREYLKGRVTREWTAFEADPDAEYSRTVTINLDELDMTVSCRICRKTPVRRASAGRPSIRSSSGAAPTAASAICASPRRFLKGHKVSDHVRCIVIPGTQQVVKDCLKEGLVDIFIDAGAIFTMPTCGPCLGGFCGVLPTASALLPPPTATLSAAWVTPAAKLFWPARRSPRLPPSWAASPRLRRCSNMFVQSTVIRYGDHVDTDVIIPARYLNTTDPAELAAHCMEDLTAISSARAKRAASSSRGATSAAAGSFLASTRPSPSRPAAFSARHRGQLRPHLLPQLD